MPDNRKDRRTQEAKLKKSGKNTAKITQALNTAAIIQENGSPEVATEICEQVIKTAPANPDVLNILGVLSCQKGKFDQAIAMIKDAITLAPDKYNFYNNLGKAQMGAGKPQDAIASFKKSLELNPNNAEARSNIAKVLQELGVN